MGVDDSLFLGLRPLEEILERPLLAVRVEAFESRPTFAGLPLPDHRRGDVRLRGCGMLGRPGTGYRVFVLASVEEFGRQIELFG